MSSLNKSAEPSASISLRTRYPLTEIAIADSNRRTVAHGIGALDHDLPTGVYHVEWGAGAALDSSLVSLRAGQHLERTDLAVALPAAAPVSGTSTTDTAHEAAAVELSEGLAVGPEQAGLMIMMRCDPRNEAVLPFNDILAGVSLARFNGEPQPLQWTVDPDRGWAIAATVLSHSAYRLRGPRTGLPARLSPQLDQSLWLPRGFKTLVFIPATGAAPRFADASVHIVSGDGAFAPGAPEAIAVEQLLWTMRSGESADLGLAAAQLLGEHPEPMGNLLAAHLELARATPDLARVEQLVAQVQERMPKHPDAQALAWAAYVAAGEDLDHGVTPRPLRWPPMLRASYEGAVRIDGEGHGVFRDGSPAVEVCARLFVEGVWTAWHPSPDLEHFHATDTTAATFQDPATRRVARHIERVLEDDAIPLSSDDEVVNDVAYLTRLPAAAVARALTDIEAAHPPVPESAEETEELVLEAAEQTCRAPAADTPPQPFERALGSLLAFAAVVFAVPGFTALLDRIMVANARPVSAAAVVAAMSRSATLALLCLFAASDVRRRAALVQIAAIAAAIEAVTIAIVLAVIGTGTIDVLGVEVEAKPLLVVGMGIDVILAYALYRLQAKAYSELWDLKTFTAGNHRTLSAVAELFDVDRDLVVPEEAALNADAYVARLPHGQRAKVRAALGVVAAWPLLHLRPSLANLPLHTRRQVVRDKFLRPQRLSFMTTPLRSSLRIAHQLASVGYYSDRRTWPVIGAKESPHSGTPPLKRRPPRVRIRSGGDESRISVDALVVGSGAAAAVMGYRLAERGLRTLIVERGPKVDPTQAPEGAMASFPELSVEDGFAVLNEFDLRVVQSAALGGATGSESPVWSAASRRTVERWNTSEFDAGIDLLGFERALDQVEEWLPGAGNPAGDPARSVTLFLEGLQKLGLDITEAPAPGLHPPGSSDDLSRRSSATFDTLIPWGQKRFGDDGLQVMTGCRAERVLLDDGRVGGVRCRVGGRSLRIDAGTVVLSAGSIHSSEILRKSGIGRNVGRRLSFDLTAGMTASFPSIIDACDGVQLATEVNADGHRFVAETRWEEPPTQALLMPGWFGQHTSNMRRYRQMMALRIHLGVDRRGRNLFMPFRQPSIGIELSDAELADLLDRLRRAGEILLAAGADQVMPHTLIYSQYDSPRSLEHLATDVRRSTEISVTARPQGGNPISRDPRKGVVGPDLRVHGHPNLRVCDASVFPNSVIRNPQLVAMALAELASTTLD